MLQRTIFLRLGLATVVGTLAFAASGQEQSEPARSQPDSATRLFVSDKLVLNVYSEPAQAGERVATIETGDSVSELERADNSVRVRLQDGREGWVGASYLTNQPPAAVRLLELQREQKSAPDKKATEDLARLRKENAALATQVKQLEASAAAAAESAATVAAAEDEAYAEPAQITEGDAAAESAPSRTTWWGALIAAVVAGGAGFAAGYETLARRVRAKFGGLKVYQ